MRVHTVARTLTVILGCIGVGWGLLAFPGLKRDLAVNDVAVRIITGYAFRPQQLLDQVATLKTIENQPYCQARGLRSDAIIRLRIAEDSLAGADVAHIDDNMATARTAIRQALSCSPTDAYLWLSLFRLDVMGEGFRPGDLALLRMSYQQGPNEGWIMIGRNQLALAIFSSLPAALAERALAEFTKLLQPEFVEVAVNNFLGPGWPIHNLLLEQIRDVPEAQRRAFAWRLEQRGHDDIIVPGIERPKPVGH